MGPLPPQPDALPRLERRPFRSRSPGPDGALRDPAAPELPGEAAASANAEFDYPLVLPPGGDGPWRRLTVLLHGLNERSWTKHLDWAQDLALRTGRPVALFPLAFHMNRAPAAWSEPRAMRRVSRERQRRLPDLKASTFANAALSTRLHTHPDRFLWSGLQTLDDLTDLAGQLHRGALPGFLPETRVDLFAYSIGAFLAEILLLADPEGLFGESRLFAFCGGSVLGLTRPVSRHILDSAAGEAVLRFFGPDLEQARRADAHLDGILGDVEAGRAFSSMLDPARNRTARTRALRRIAPRLRALALAGDEVVPADAVTATFEGTGVPVERLEPGPSLTHVTPLPTAPGPERDRAHDRVFGGAAAFLG